VWIPVPDDLITETGSPPGKIRRGRLFAAAAGHLRSRSAANLSPVFRTGGEGQRRAGLLRTHENAKSASLHASYTHSSEPNKESTDTESHAEVQNHMRVNLLCGLFSVGRLG
jgi:hypothetical protein